ncbi:MAG: sugar phosphate isomerase/epimerase [Akkermansiaceae bacterium]|nr:sugar phosphate isomerase/epimerase [Akkermansiaceae bacterium]MCP5542899.1 sugar phosphate isomerase/epimerase [Akkermansiaceae bacterium]
MKIGASTWLWVSPLTTDAAETLIPRIAEMGFGAVELPIEDPDLLDAKRIASMASNHGLDISVCGAFGPGRDLTHPDPKVRAATQDYLCRCFDFAAEVGAPLLGGPLYSEVGKRRQLPEAERRAEWNLAVAGIREACEEAAQRNLRIAIEPINRFETDLVHTAADAVRMAREVGHPAAGVMLDSFHMTIEEDDLAEAVRTAGDRLIHMQVSENQRGIPGTGQTNWPALAGALRGICYDGLVTIESFTPENRDLAAAVCIWNRRAPDQDTFARNGLEFLKQHFANAPS